MSAPGSDQVFRHEALLYSGEQQFLAGVVPFIRGALAAGDPVLVAVDRAKIRLLSMELAGDAARVRFADMREVGANPARLIPAWQEFVEAHTAPGTRI